MRSIERVKLTHTHTFLSCCAMRLFVVFAVLFIFFQRFIFHMWNSAMQASFQPVNKWYYHYNLVFAGLPSNFRVQGSMRTPPGIFDGKVLIVSGADAVVPMFHSRVQAPYEMKPADEQMACLFACSCHLVMVLIRLEWKLCLAKEMSVSTNCDSRALSQIWREIVWQRL